MAQGGVKLFGGKVTVRAEPFFWLMAGLFGLSLGRGSPRDSAAWAAIIGLSVLAHELGHAAVCLMWGKGADVVLHGFGGATRPRDGSRFGTWRTAALDLAGCAAGFSLAALAVGVLYMEGVNKGTIPPAALKTASRVFAVNVWFSVFNLLPISPMDGGKLLSGLLSARWGVGGRRVAHAVGLALGAGAALWFYKDGALYGALLCGAMAAGEGRSLKRSMAMTAADSDESLTSMLPTALGLWDMGQRAEAVKVLTELREKAKAGLTYDSATLHLAFLLYLLDRFEESHALFKQAPEGDMSAPVKRAYADAALRGKDFETALRLGRTNFHDQPGPETALAAARAAAGLGDARETAAWLKSALRLGLDRNALRAREFDAVRGTEEYRELVDGSR